ncbi:MAG TPA: aldose epimerase, partial [Clostridiaceae bacterium]|nr:aldose epimerase [Clostridiaceae bacterium]
MVSLIKNEFLTLKAESKGAEMISLKDNMDSTEYIWQGNPDVWNRHAPILFPIVGKLKNNKYKIDGTVYEMSQHGFARDMEFNLTEQKDNRIKYELKSDEETLKKYPYKFKLTVEYILNKNKVDVVYSVDN